MEFRLKFSVKDETCVSSAANFKKARKEKKGVVISLTPRQNSNIYHLKLILFGTKKGKLEINISLYSTLQTIGVFKIFSWCFHCQRWPITSFTTAPNTKKLPLESVFFSQYFFTMTKEVILHHRASSVPWCTLFRMQCFLFPFIDETVQLTTFALLQVFDTQFFIEVYLRWQI